MVRGPFSPKDSKQSGDPAALTRSGVTTGNVVCGVIPSAAASSLLAPSRAGYNEHKDHLERMVERMEPLKATATDSWRRWLTQEPDAWPLRRLFWSTSVPAPQEAADPARVATVLRTILEEGSPADWRTIRWDAVRPLWDSLRIHPRFRPFWELYWKEMDAIDRRSRVLDEEQHQVLQLAANVLPAYGFALAGGTALAAGYLGHRLSDDLDLFGVPMRPDEWQAAHAALNAAWRGQGLSVRAEGVQKSFARYWVGERPVKVELAQDSPYQLDPSSATVDGMPIRSLKDLAADKTLALFGRATTRDFVDVYLLLQRYEMSQLMSWAALKDPGFNQEWFIRALTQVERVDPADVTMLVPLDWEHLRMTFRQTAVRLDRQARDEDHELEP